MRTTLTSVWLLLAILSLAPVPSYSQTLTISLDARSGMGDPQWTIDDPRLVTALANALESPAVLPVRRLPDLGFRGFTVMTATKELPPTIRVSMGVVVFEKDGKQVFVRCPPSLERMLMQSALPFDTRGLLEEYERAIQSTEAGTPVDQIDASQQAVKWALLRHIYAGNSQVVVSARRIVAQERPLDVKLAAINAIRDFGNESDLTLLETLARTSTDPTVKQSCKFAIEKLRQRLSNPGAD